MRTRLAALGVCATAALSWSACSGGAGATGTVTGTVTATGRVVDLVCYTRDPAANAGMDHDDGFECAMACVKWEGNPVGLATDDGRLYQFSGNFVANNNEKIAPFVAQRVTVTGDAYEEAGMLMLAASAVSPAE